MKIINKEKYSENELLLIKSENFEHYLKLFKNTMFVQIIFPFILCYVFYAHIPAIILISWLIATQSVTLLRVYVNYFWYQADFNASKRQLFEFVSLLLSFIAGCLWGITVLVVNFNQYPEASVFLNIVVFGFTVGSVGVGSYWFEYFLTYNLTVFFIYICFYFIGFPESYYLLAFSLMVFLAFIIQIVLTYHKNNAQNTWLIKRNEKMAKDLLNKKNQAEDFAESRTRFLASASHDLRQPLQALNLFLSVLKTEIDTDKGQMIFNQLEKCTDDFNELLESILDISKLDANTLVVERKPCSLNHILDNLKRQFELQASDKGLILSIDVTEHYLCADMILLQRVLSNIIANAIRYTVVGRIKVKCIVQGERLMIDVSDTGPGINKEEQSKIFEEFYQLNNPERNQKRGLGLGLSIVKRLCQLMDIPLTLNSKENQGSSFTLVVPLSENVKSIEPPGNSEIELCLNAKRILVIDDDANIRRGLKELLLQWDCQVLTAESESDALKLLDDSRYTPNLIIADYRLSNNKTGVEAIIKIKKFLNNESLPAIIISGDTEPSRLKEVAKSGYVLLHKPVRPAQLRMMIQRST